jgi:hypothetical protein
MTSRTQDTSSDELTWLAGAGAACVFGLALICWLAARATLFLTGQPGSHGPFDNSPASSCG